MNCTWCNTLGIASDPNPSIGYHFCHETEVITNKSRYCIRMVEIIAANSNFQSQPLIKKY